MSHLPFWSADRAAGPSSRTIWSWHESRARRSAKETPEATLLHQIGSLKRCEIWGTRFTRHPSIFPAPIPFSPFFFPPLPYFFHHLIRVVRDSRNASLSRFHHNFVNLTMSSTNEERRETRGEAWHTRVARNFTKVAAREHPRLAHVEQLVSPAFGASWNCFHRQLWAVAKVCNDWRWKEGKHASKSREFPLFK